MLGVERRGERAEVGNRDGRASRGGLGPDWHRAKEVEAVRVPPEGAKDLGWIVTGQIDPTEGGPGMVQRIGVSGRVLEHKGGECAPMSRTPGLLAGMIPGQEGVESGCT